MNNSSLRFALSAAVALTSAAVLDGCATMGRSGSSGSSGYRGTLTITNQTGLRVCAVDPYTVVERHPHVSEEIAPGASTTIAAERDINRFQVMECETNRLLFGDPLAFLNERQMHQGPIGGGQINLLAPGASGETGDNGWSFAMQPLDTDEALRHFGVACMSRRGVPDGYTFMQNEEAASAAITQLNAAVRAQGWTERYTFAAVVSDDWVPIQERRLTSEGPAMVTVGRRVTVMAGARHDTGYCSMRGQDVRQAYDGSEATSPLVLGGIGPVFQIPCTLLDAAASFPGAATGG